MELSVDFWKFIEENINAEPNSLRLKYSNKNSEILNFAITQIDCRQRSKSKLASWIKNAHFLFPSTLSFEQSTSELLAEFHASIISDSQTVLDMTCGLGIDAMTIAKKSKYVKAIELNESIVAVATHNAKVCNISNIEFINDDSIRYLKNTSECFDVIFVDPARRDFHNKRTFAFEDCLPDIVSNFDLISQHASQLIIKASPMLDITSILNQVKLVSDIWILSIKNECKEILIKVDFINKPQQYILHPINFTYGRNYIGTDIYSEREKANVNFIGEIATNNEYHWIYEPNSSYMKTFAWDLLCENFPKLEKLNTNTHLFLSTEFYEKFPGRVLKIVELMSLKGLKKLKGEKINIIIRNAPITVESIKKQFKLQDGGNRFLYVCSFGKNNKTIAVIAEP